jgi:hypothetical protein
MVTAATYALVRSPGDTSSHPQDHLAPTFASPTLTLQCRKGDLVNPQANAFAHLKRLLRACALGGRASPPSVMVEAIA